jgi:flagellar hook-associated protein 3 FlgL
VRVSSNENFEKMTYKINLLQSKMAEQQLQMSTGKSFEKISDAPLKANQSLLIKSSYDRVSQFQKNINDAKGFLNVVDTTFGSVVDVLQDVKQKAILASNGTYSAEDRQTFADTVENAITHVVDLSNTQFLGKYIFSGEKTKTEAFTYDGVTATYQGDTTDLSINTSNSSNVKVSETGDVAFQGVLDSLINLRDQILSNNTTNIENATGQLDIALNQTIDLRSNVGTRLNALDTLNEIYENTKTNLDTRKEEVEGVDYVKIISDFANTQRMYQGTIQANVKVMDTSILNYI